jgi:hypothetical protein
MRAKALFLTLFLSLTMTQPVGLQARYALPLAQAEDDQAILQFPDSITFQAQIQSDIDINSVVLEYGSDQQTCGSVVAKAFPQFTPGKQANVQWTWEMKQSGSLPPGATVWWQWQFTDVSGRQSISNRQTVTWLDNQHDWQALTGGDIHLHWYSGGTSFGQELHEAAVQGLQQVEQQAGLSTDRPVDMYIYANTQDMQDAILYEPSWTGGQAFPEYNIVIIGISPDQIDWGKRTEVHELTHVLVGHLTFSCLGFVPTWLNEGLAVYSEGQLDPSAQSQLNAAIQNDTLLSVRSLSGSFSEVSSTANLSYSESYSLVKYLIEAYGRDRMTLLLLALRDGNTIDEALQKVYGFDVDGLEDYWRTAVGAQPRSQVPNPTATPTATLVPTYVPFNGVQSILPSGTALALTALPPPFQNPTPAAGTGKVPLSLSIILALTACVLVIVLAVIGLTVFLSTRGQGRGK